jgi:hypothetical protein
VRRNVSTRSATLAWIKDQQNSIATTENHGLFSSYDNLQTHGITIEPFRSIKIFRVQDCLKDSAWSHRGTLYSGSPNENKISYASRRRGSIGITTKSIGHHGFYQTGFKSRFLARRECFALRAVPFWCTADRMAA